MQLPGTLTLIYYQDLRNVVYKNTLHKPSVACRAKQPLFSVLINFIALWIIICFFYFFITTTNLIILFILWNMKWFFVICSFEENVVFSFLVLSYYRFVNLYFCMYRSQPWSCTLKYVKSINWNGKFLIGFCKLKRIIIDPATPSIRPFSCFSN